MALSVNTGSFAKSVGGAPASQSITGVGFQPKALFFWAVGVTANATWTANYRNSFGYATAASVGMTQSAYMVNGGSAYAGDSRVVATKAFTIVHAGSTAADAECDLTSFDADGFTLNWTTNNATAYIIHYLAIGGTDLTNAAVASIASGTTTGNLSVTGVGFKPDCVIHIGTSNGDQATFGIGCMDKNGNQWSVANSMNNFGSTQEAATAYDTTAAILGVAAHTTSVITRATFVSMDSDGYTVNYASRGSGYPVYSLCLKGGKYFAGNFAKTTAAATASQAVTGVGFKPKGFLIGNNGQASGTAVAGCRQGFGGTDGTNVGSSTLQSKNAGTVPVTHCIDKTSTVIAKANNDSQTIDAEASLTSLDNDGFTLSWTTNDGVATTMVYLAMGNTSSGTVIPVQLNGGPRDYRGGIRS